MGEAGLGRWSRGCSLGPVRSMGALCCGALRLGGGRNREQHIGVLVWERHGWAVRRVWIEVVLQVLRLVLSVLSLILLVLTLLSCGIRLRMRGVRVSVNVT